jgi:hypothetical protein
MSKDSESIVKDNARKPTESKKDKNVKILGSGTKVRLHPVSAALIQELQEKVPEPEVPTFTHPETGKISENLGHPEYKAKVAAADAERISVALDAMIMFGVELLDGLPEDDNWVKKLNLLDIEVDANDDIEKEFAYKKYILIDSDTLMEISRISGVTEDQIQTAMENFPG